MTQLESLSALLHIPDLILLLLLLWSVVSGARRGLIQTVIGLVGWIAVVLGAGWLSRLFTPMLAKAVVTPLVGKAFTAYIGQDAALSGILDQVEITVTKAATAMAEGVAFLILFVLFALALSALLALVSHSLNFLTRFPPLGWLNRLAGAALGLVGGIAVILLALKLCYVSRPDLFGPLGVLSPDRIADTVLLRGLFTYFPIR